MGLLTITDSWAALPLVTMEAASMDEVKARSARKFTPPPTTTSHPLRPTLKDFSNKLSSSDLSVHTQVPETIYPSCLAPSTN
jgi:hypothetical protein